MEDKGALISSCSLFAVEDSFKAGSQVMYGTAESNVNNCLLYFNYLFKWSV
jgi:hypothetical protein